MQPGRCKEWNPIRTHIRNPAHPTPEWKESSSRARSAANARCVCVCVCVSVAPRLYHRCVEFLNVFVSCLPTQQQCACFVSRLLLGVCSTWCHLGGEERYIALSALRATYSRCCIPSLICTQRNTPDVQVEKWGVFDSIFLSDTKSDRPYPSATGSAFRVSPTASGWCSLSRFCATRREPFQRPSVIHVQFSATERPSVIYRLSGSIVANLRLLDAHS